MPSPAVERISIPVNETVHESGSLQNPAQACALPLFLPRSPIESIRRSCPNILRPFSRNATFRNPPHFYRTQNNAAARNATPYEPIDRLCS